MAATPPRQARGGGSGLIFPRLRRARRVCYSVGVDPVQGKHRPVNANELEALCAAWPGVASSVKWEDDLVFTVAAKMFAVLCLRGPDRDRISFKVEPARFLELTDQPGIVPAHYMARAFWITIVEPERFQPEQVETFVRRSYELVRSRLSKKQQTALIEQESAVPPARGARKGKR